MEGTVLGEMVPGNDFPSGEAAVSEFYLDLLGESNAVLMFFLMMVGSSFPLRLEMMADNPDRRPRLESPNIFNRLVENPLSSLAAGPGDMWGKDEIWQ